MAVWCSTTSSGRSPSRRGPKFGLDRFEDFHGLRLRAMSPARPSPLQNRVAPDGSLHAVPERGLLMGNRGGRLHRPDGTLGHARWRSRAWIACLTEFRGRHRAVWGESYSELFFLDEATALAAGHRPCFECRRAAARAFAEAWGHARPPSAPRDGPRAARRTPRPARPPALRPTCPPGAIFAAAGGFHLQDANGCACLELRRLPAGARLRRRRHRRGGHARARPGGARRRLPAGASSRARWLSSAR